MATAPQTPQTPPTVPDVATAPDPALPSQQFDPIAWVFTLSLSPFKQGMDQLAENVHGNATVAYNAAEAAAESAGAASDSASNLAELEILYGSLDSRYLGVKSADPGTGNSGVPLAAGMFYVNSVTGYIRAYNGASWVQGISALTGVESINGQQGAITLPTLNGRQLLGAGSITTLPVYGYDDRGGIRSVAAANGDAAVISGLGLFVYQLGAVEIDDDETCFLTPSGAWLLHAPSWDFVAVMLSDALSAQRRSISVACPVLSVSANSVATFKVFVPFAAIGDAVIVSAPSSIPTTGVVQATGYVSAHGEVTVVLSNPTAGSRSIQAAESWRITVLKD